MFLVIYVAWCVKVILKIIILTLHRNIKRDRRIAVYEHKTDRVNERIAKQTKSRTQFGMQTRDHECNYIFSTIVMIH